MIDSAPQEEEYQQKKRHLSEQFFNLRISQKSASTSALGRLTRTEETCAIGIGKDTNALKLQLAAS